MPVRTRTTSIECDIAWEFKDTEHALERFLHVSEAGPFLHVSEAGPFLHVSEAGPFLRWRGAPCPFGRCWSTGDFL